MGPCSRRPRVHRDRLRALQRRGEPLARLPGLAAARPSRARAAAATRRGRAGADGWDTEELDASIAAMEAALRRAKPGEAVGWFSYGHAAYRLRFTVEAATRARALEAIRPRCVPPDGLTVTFEAEPSARSAD